METNLIQQILNGFKDDEESQPSPGGEIKVDWVSLMLILIIIGIAWLGAILLSP